MKKLLAEMVLFAAAALMLACATSQGGSLPPVGYAVSDEALPYEIKVGDALDIKFYETPELDASVTVRPDGKISLLLIGDVQAAGRTPIGLDEFLTEKYSHELREPEIAVIVATVTEDQIYVGGEIGNPTVMTLTEGLTALRAILRAGGFEKTAKVDDVIIVRGVVGQVPTLLHLDLRTALSTGHGDELLRPFDVVFVPQSSIAKVNQFVSQYIDQVIPTAILQTFQGFLLVKTIEDAND